MWVPLEVCECGSENISRVAVDDRSTGYHDEEWRCMSCGANCEAYEPATSRMPVATELGQQEEQIA